MPWQKWLRALLVTIQRENELLKIKIYKFYMYSLRLRTVRYFYIHYYWFGTRLMSLDTNIYETNQRLQELLTIQIPEIEFELCA